ncbi:hypothetical protein [Cryobacterium sp. SO1]|uniref:hypothetical protein n=1 Tax=Cryobacterium sp. SO1 TaxID=1897061 RepID=UPI00197A9B29|nr:hypothetical protein [Cryobacterium sp. SO1]
MAELAVDDVVQFAGGVRLTVVGQVPRSTGGLRMLAEHCQPFADVGDIRVGVRLVEVAENCSGPAGDRRREQTVAEV